MAPHPSLLNRVNVPLRDSAFTRLTPPSWDLARRKYICIAHYNFLRNTRLRERAERTLALVLLITKQQLKRKLHKRTLKLNISLFQNLKTSDKTKKAKINEQIPPTSKP
jgi:hypothetical protein